MSRTKKRISIIPIKATIIIFTGLGSPNIKKSTLAKDGNPNQSNMDGKMNNPVMMLKAK